MLQIAIDGACRRNGKPDCVSAGGVIILQLDDKLDILDTKLLSVNEYESTNQRGELLALLEALDYIATANQEAQVITDSEYIFNTITKDWYKSWMRKGWITAGGTPVKNKDIWTAVAAVLSKLTKEITLYHIKGHTISFGKVTATNLINQDNTGLAIYLAVYDKLLGTGIKYEIKEVTDALSIKNNGFKLSKDILYRFIVLNTVADAMATQCVEVANAILTDNN